MCTVTEKEEAVIRNRCSSGELPQSSNPIHTTQMSFANKISMCNTSCTSAHVTFRHMVMYMYVDRPEEWGILISYTLKIV